MKKTSIIATVAAIALILVISSPFFSFAAGTTVTVQTDAASYPTGQAGTHVIISGTVSPAPGQTGYSVTLEINTTQGLLSVYSTSVDATSGAYSYTMTTGYAANGWINGTYTITAVYATSVNGPTSTASTTFKYGTTGTTTTTPTTTSSTATTVTKTVTSTVSTTATITQTATTSVVGPVVTATVPTTVSTTVTGPTVTTTSTATNVAWVAVGVGGIVAAVILGGLAFMFARRR